MLSAWIISVPLLFTTTFAQINVTEVVSQLPNCTRACSAEKLTAAQCLYTDMQNCLCTNVTLQSQLFFCVLESCNVTEQLVSANISQNLICKGIPQPSRSEEIVWVVIIITAITIPVIFLRIVSRHVTAQIWWDDWFVVVTAIFMVPMTIIPILNAKNGFGKHAWDVPPTNLTLLYQLFYVSQILYIVTQSIVKISILLLYLRIFPGPRFRLWTKIMMAWIACHVVAFVISDSLQCTPVDALWNFNIKAECISPTGIVYACAALSILEDIVIILLPIPELKNLKSTLRRRIALIFMFTLGSFACVTSMVRLKFVVSYSSHSLDATWENVDIVIWSVIEIYTAMICASLTAIRPLLVRYFPSCFPTTRNKQNTSSNTSWRLRIGSKLGTRIWKKNSNVESQRTQNLEFGLTPDSGMYKTTEFEVTETSVANSSDVELETGVTTV